MVLDFVNNLSGRSVYEAMSRELAYHPAIRAPKSFKGFMEFEVTGFPVSYTHLLLMTSLL